MAVTLIRLADRSDAACAGRVSRTRSGCRALSSRRAAFRGS